MIANFLSRLAAVALLMTALPVLADAGAFQFVSGEVRIVRPDGRELIAAKGARLEEGDTVVTGANGHAQLLMADQALISLRPDSTLRFETYRFAGKEDGSEKGILGLIKGGFRTLTGLIGRANKSNYQVRTPTATIGIRGTDHEPFHIPPEGWSGAPGADPGTYNRVNAGATYLQTEGGRIELGANQVGFVPPSPQAVPSRLDRIPDFMRPPAMPRGQGERRGAQDGSGRRGPPPRGGQMPPPPSGGQLPPPPPGGLPPRSGDIRPFFEPLAAEESFGFNQAVAELTPAPIGTAMVGGDRSNDTYGQFFGSGAGVAAPVDLEILLDSTGHLAIVSDQDGFRYARSGAPLVNAGSASFTDSGNQVNVKWGIYAGGAIVDNMGPRPTDFFHFMVAQGTPVAVATTLTGNYATLIGHTAVITELGMGMPTYNTAYTNITLTGGSVTHYEVKLSDDGFGRAWNGIFSGSVPVGQFVQGGVALTGSGPGGTASGSGHGVPIGPTGQGIISSYDLKTATSGITGAFALQQ
ncbi:MAG: FecR family protein [Rhodocyclaceae bacterium]|jgi:hypothetical protein|nr:FecR family protein [Rhodocyclaceae bacterium]